MPKRTTRASKTARDALDHHVSPTNANHPPSDGCALNAVAAGAGWADLPPLALQGVFDLLPVKNLAACACVCASWRSEAEEERRWELEWLSSTSPQNTPWRWSQAAGGFRKKLCAREAVKKGADLVEALS